MPELQLNPADLAVDESMPTYIPSLSFAKLTDDEVAAGKPLRLAARKKVQDNLNSLLNEEKTFKKNVKNAWPKLSEADKKLKQVALDNFNKNDARKALISYIKTELVWWDNNLEVSVRQVNTRDIKYDETFAKMMEASRNYKPNTKDTSKDEVAAKKALRSRTLYDDLYDSLSILWKWLFVLIYILVGLRCASFAANEVLYKPVPYRVLTFVYTFLFVPIFGPYYLWKVVKNLIWKITTI